MGHVDTERWFGPRVAPVHDDVVRMVFHKRAEIAAWAFASGVISCNPFARGDSYDCIEIECELEYELRGGKWFADLALFRSVWLADDDPAIDLRVSERELLFLVEVKSEREEQSASGWYRQTRCYSQASGVPCVLAVAHSLGETQREYLKLAYVPVCDIRKL
jgi:hypothetical protein